MYVLLTEKAIATLDETQQFSRGPDNTVFHKGYPINYRQQGGSPSIQISIALDRRHADIDVDYRSSGFPAGLFNGHLTSANSDVRAGNNFDRHTNRWAGFQNWWRNFFGLGNSNGEEAAKERDASIIPATPRAGNKSIDVMVDDFLRAWLVDGDALGAMSYVSERAYACLAQDGDERFAFDRGLAPFQLLMNLKASRDALGRHDSLEGFLTGVRLTTPGLRVVQQPHHAQFVVYEVPDDIAVTFDCQSRLQLGQAQKASRTYGKYYGATFYANGRTDHSVALLWAKDGGHWKIVSWQTEAQVDEDATAKGESAVAAATVAPRATAAADPTLVTAAKDFLDNWLIRKNQDAALKYFAPSSYACSTVGPDPNAPPAASADPAQRIRGALERSSQPITQKTLAEVLASVPPVNPTSRLLRHAYSATFTLASVPNGMIAAADCAARARGERVADLAPEYGLAFGQTFRFRTLSGETPVVRLLWVKDPVGWRIRAYDVEYP
jgi:hypothetical protein